MLPHLTHRRVTGKSRLSCDGLTIWLTGLPGSGKTTLAGLIGDHLHAIGLPYKILDGDMVRQWLTHDLGYSKDDRNENIRRMAFLAKSLSRIGAVSIVAAISPYAAARNAARQEVGNFVEVFVRCPIAVCMQRDPKGLYAKARQGHLGQFTGVSDPYEDPLTPEVIVNTHQETPQESVEKILRHVFLGHLRHLPVPVDDRNPAFGGYTDAGALDQTGLGHPSRETDEQRDVVS